MTTPRRIAVARIWQETNSFSQRPTLLADFERSDWLAGAELLAGLGGRTDELAGFADVLGPAGAEIVPLIAASSWPGGPAEPALLAAIIDRLERALADAGKLDGVAISLHGAMSSEAEPDIEGAVLSRLRALVGDALPIVATLDHHANLTERMIGAADAITAYRHCPHVDMRETGRRGAQLLLDMIEDRFSPATAWRKLPLVTPCERFMTGDGPMKAWFDLARALEAEPGIRDISLFPVQPWLDVPEFGWSVLVLAERGHEETAERAARALAAHAWTHRAAFTVEKWTPGAAVTHAAGAARGPVVLADGADATNGGSPGDSTELLAEFIAQEIAAPAYLTLVDPAAVAAAFAAGQGAEIALDLGAGISTRFHQPVRTRVRIERLNHGRFRVTGHISADVDMGRMAMLAIGPIRVVASEFAGPGHDPGVYRHMGLDPGAAQIVVVKSTVGHMDAFGPIMAESLPVECRGPSPSRLERLNYGRAARPLYPLDRDMEWSAK